MAAALATAGTVVVVVGDTTLRAGAAALDFW
jgi:hypothetical protein